MNVIESTGAIVVEPDWESLFSDVLEIVAAKEHWRIVTTELKDRQLLAAANGHSVQRLVCAYLMFDRVYRQVAENGVVSKPRRGNSKAIARVSPYFMAMREGGSDAATGSRNRLRQRGVLAEGTAGARLTYPIDNIRKRVASSACFR